tara:strand:+ start:4280 stop:4606 length:327 start_codon:yes stop_codon:yes gene_type:complete
MGGSTGRAIDQFTGGLAQAGLTGGHKTNMEQGANDLQTHVEKQWQGLLNTDFMDAGSKLPGAKELGPALEPTPTENNNPFSMASYGNNVRQRRKSGFGRRQTFKGLTG